MVGRWLWKESRGTGVALLLLLASAANLANIAANLAAFRESDAGLAGTCPLPWYYSPVTLFSSAATWLLTWLDALVAWPAAWLDSLTATWLAANNPAASYSMLGLLLGA